MAKPPSVPELRWDIRELQKKLKKLGVAPPPPKGKPALTDIMKPGKFYVVAPTLKELGAYHAQLQAAVEAQGSAWTAGAYLHSVLGAALDAAPESERLARPHGHVAAKPVIDNHGYLALALLATERVAPLVTAPERERFERWHALARRVAAREPMSTSDVALLNREVPFVKQPNRALSRNITAKEPVLAIAQAAGLEAEQADDNNVAGKGAREACSRAVRLLTKPGEARRFLEDLDALIQREDARLQFEKVSEQPSAPVVAGRWRGARRERRRTGSWSWRTGTTRCSGRSRAGGGSSRGRATRCWLPCPTLTSSRP